MAIYSTGQHCLLPQTVLPSVGKMHTGNGRSGSESEPDLLLRSCSELLSRHDFTAVRDVARRIPRSDPNIAAQVDQVLTICEVLGSSRLPGSTTTHLNWYSILQLSPADAADRDNVRQQFKTLVRLLDPNKNNFPLADDALMRVREAWLVLSDPVQRARFDRELASASASASGAASAAFWTMCPYCWYLHEYEKKYEDCTFRCGNCRRTFHGVEVKAPAAESVVQGKDQYYCYHLSLPLRYPLDKVGFEGNDKKRLRIKTVANRVPMKVFMDSNSDSDL